MSKVLLIDVKLWAYLEHHRKADIHKMLENIFTACSTNGLLSFSRIFFCYDDRYSKYHRAVLPSYKEHRTEQRKKDTPAEQKRHAAFNKKYNNLVELTKYFGTNIKIPFVEADTIIEVLSNQLQHKHDVYIASGDGDFMCLLDNPKLRQITPKYEVLNEQGVINKKGIDPKGLFASKCISGDKKDNIHGLYLIGEILNIKTGKKFKKIWEESCRDTATTIDILQGMVDNPETKVALPTNYPPENPVGSVDELFKFNYKLNNPMVYSDLLKEDADILSEQVNTRQEFMDKAGVAFVAHKAINEMPFFSDELLAFYKIKEK